MIRLSLIIPTFNRSALLLQTLQSVAEQSASAGEWECVVVNNNSTDDTAECFEKFCETCPNLNIRMVFEANQGLSYARNRGIRESVGEYMAFIDDDEHISKDFISSYIYLFDTVPDAVAAGGPIVAEYPAGAPRWMSRFTERPIANTLYLGDKVREFPVGKIPGGGNMALRRSAVKRYGVFDISLGRKGGNLVGGEESDLFERLQIAGARYFYVPGAVMHHIIIPEKLTDDYFERLSYNVGVSQLLRAKFFHRVGRARLAEMGKWAATLTLAAWYFVTLQWGKAKYLVKMRYHISRGLWSK